MHHLVFWAAVFIFLQYLLGLRVMPGTAAHANTSHGSLTIERTLRYPPQHPGTEPAGFDGSGRLGTAVPTCPEADHIVCFSPFFVSFPPWVIRACHHSLSLPGSPSIHSKDDWRQLSSHSAPEIFLSYRDLENSRVVDLPVSALPLNLSTMYGSRVCVCLVQRHAFSSRLNVRLPFSRLGTELYCCVALRLASPIHCFLSPFILASGANVPLCGSAS